MAARQKYAAWAKDAAANVLVAEEALKNFYKNEFGFPANSKDDVEKGFADSKLYWPYKDLYYTGNYGYEAPYIERFHMVDKKAPFRDRYKRTDLGNLTPQLIPKDKQDGPKPGESLVTPRGYPLPIIQDESADLSHWRMRNLIDWHVLDFAVHYNDPESYLKHKLTQLQALGESKSQCIKLNVDNTITSILGIGAYAYPLGHDLYRFFAENDDKTPDEDFSKLAHGFYKNEGEFKKLMKEATQYIRKNYIARVGYLTNNSTHEVIGNNQDLTVPKWKDRLADRSDKNKMIATARDWYFDKDANQKYTKAVNISRRSSLLHLGSAILGVVDRMQTRDVRNWCGHDFAKEHNAETGLALRSRPENLIVLMNQDDYREMGLFTGSDLAGPFTDNKPMALAFEDHKSRGVSFYGVPFILPGMAIVMDEICYKFVEYFDETREQEFPYDMVESIIQHTYFKPMLFRKVTCNVIEPAKGQKYALPINWGSENMPFLRDQT